MTSNIVLSHAISKITEEIKVVNWEVVGIW